MIFDIFSTYWLQSIWTYKMASLINSITGLWLWRSTFFDYITTLNLVLRECAQDEIFHRIFHLILLRPNSSFNCIFFTWLPLLSSSGYFLIFMKLIFSSHLRKGWLVGSYRKWVIIIFVTLNFCFALIKRRLIAIYTLFALLLSNGLFCKLQKLIIEICDFFEVGIIYCT